MTAPICFVEFNRPPGNTIDLIHLAHQWGHPVVVVTTDPDAAADLPDHVELVAGNTADGSAIADLLRPQKPAAVLTAHDFYVPAAADAAQLLGLPGPDPAAVRACRRKDSQRTRLAEHGVRQPVFRLAASPEQAVARADQIGYPVVIKPVALADSIGVLQCADAKAVRAHVQELADDVRYRPRRPASGNVVGEVLIESVLEGPEFTVELFDGRALAVARTHFLPPPGYIEGHHVVAAPNDTVANTQRIALMATAEQAVAALGLGYGPIHAELRLTAEGPAIVEVNARLAGGRLPRLHQLTHRINMWDAWLRTVLGKPCTPTATHDRAGVLRFIHIGGSEAGPAPQVDANHIQGEVVLLPTPAVPGRPTRSSEHAGWAITTGPTPQHCLDELDELWETLSHHLPLWPPVVGETT